ISCQCLLDDGASREWNPGEAWMRDRKPKMITKAVPLKAVNCASAANDGSEHDLRANASRLSRGKPVRTFPDQALISQRHRPSDPAIMESVSRHFFGRIDVAQIHDHRSRHDGGKLLEVERAELLPLRHDDDGMCAPRAIIGTPAEGHILEHLPGLRHTDRIEDANLRSHVL